MTGTNDADGDFTSICDQDLFEHLTPQVRLAKLVCDYGTPSGEMNTKVIPAAIGENELTRGNEGGKLPMPGSDGSLQRDISMLLSRVRVSFG